MDHRLELERRGRDPVQVHELTLDNCRPNNGNGNSNTVSEKLGEYVNLERLRMVNTGLTSLKGFPRLSSLKKCADFILEPTSLETSVAFSSLLCGKRLETAGSFCEGENVGKTVGYEVVCRIMTAQGLVMPRTSQSPVFVCASELDISDNRLNGGLEHLVEACPSLQSLNMGGNHFRDFESLEPLKNLPALKHVDLFNCEVFGLENYRETVLKLLPQLTDLDSFNREGLEVSDSEEDSDADDDSPEGENDSDEENLPADESGNYADDSLLENGVGGSDSEDEQSDEEDEESDEEDQDSGNLSGLVNGHGLAVPVPKFPQEDIDNEEYEVQDDDDEDEQDDGVNEVSFETSSENHPQGVKRPHSDDENEDEENAEDVEPGDDLGPGENSQ